MRDFVGTPLRRKDERARSRGDDRKQLGAVVVPAIVTSQEQPAAVSYLAEPRLVVGSAFESLRKRDDIDTSIA